MIARIGSASNLVDWRRYRETKGRSGVFPVFWDDDDTRQTTGSNMEFCPQIVLDQWLAWNKRFSGHVPQAITLLLKPRGQPARQTVVEMGQFIFQNDLPRTRCRSGEH